MTDATRNCPHCGKRLTRLDASFCTNCGIPLRVETAPTIHGGSLAKVIIHIGGHETREEFLSRAVTALGRRSSNDIQLLSPTVSGEHAKIEITRKGHAITDLNSTNGTFLNGRRLKPNRPCLLAANDIIRFSDHLGNSISLTYVAPSSFGEIDQEDIGRVFTLTEPVAYIGRNPKAAICLNHPAVSWNHARVVRRADSRRVIEDLSSNNGTFLNGTQLRQAGILDRGDVTQIGPFNLVYPGNDKFILFSAERNFRLEAVQLEKAFYPADILGRPDRSRPFTVVRNLNLVINPREFVAIVGGSGAGKSTLLKALSGLSRATAGVVLVNGDNLYDNFNLYRNLMGYVPQDDIIHQNLEVRQALRYAARLRLPDVTSLEIENRIDQVLASVGLSGHAHRLVRHLSGGQRKRVSIAVELLAQPWIFFLDEPTSGLDPGLEKLMMDTLRQLADEGRTIILVTHATGNITNTCDQVAFMAYGGELAYFGPPDRATDFFGVDNFPDIYTRLSQVFHTHHDSTIPEEIKAAYSQALQVETPRAKNEKEPEILAGPLWAARYRQSPIYQTYIASRQSGEVARPMTASKGPARGGLSDQLKQFGVLAQRYFDLIRHDNFSLWVLLAVMPVIGLLLLLLGDSAALVGHTAEEIKSFLDSQGVYNIADKAQVLLFMMALSANLLGLFAAAYEIVKEQTIYRRERMISLKLLPYLASKFAVLAVFMLLQCLLLLLVLSLKVDFPYTGAIVWSPLEYYVTLVLAALASVALGLFISAVAPSRDMVIYLVLLVLFAQIVFSGVIFELSPVTRPLSYLTITRWTQEALGTSTNMAGLNNLGQVRIERVIDLGRGVQKVIQDAPTTISFDLNYTHSGLALLARWIFLLVHILVWSSLAVWKLKTLD